MSDFRMFGCLRSYDHRMIRVGAMARTFSIWSTEAHSLWARPGTWKPLPASQRTCSCSLVQCSKSYSASLYISQ